VSIPFTKITNYTIVVLSRNHERFISDCLSSIYRELSDIKVVCADIGSRDETFKLGKQIALEFGLKSLHVQLSEDTKTLTALKKLEPYIETENVILISADDALGINYREALIDINKTKPGIKVVNFVSLITDQDLNPLRAKYPKWSPRTKKNKKHLSYSNPGNAPGAVIPWEILVDTLGWNQSPNIMIEDYWLWWQLIDRVPFVTAEKSHVLYRQHSNNVSKDTKNRDYAYALGYVSALPMVKNTQFVNKVLSVILIPRWIRHLNILVWKNYAEGYQSAIRNEIAE